MTVKPNGTHAKDIASLFVSLFLKRATPSEFKRTVANAKTILESGYTKEEIMEVIQYLHDYKSLNLYSIGYINACMRDTLREIEQIKSNENLEAIQKELKSKMNSFNQTQSIEVKTCGESSQRNRDKISRFGIEPGKREKHYINLFEKH